MIKIHNTSDPVRRKELQEEVLCYGTDSRHNRFMNMPNGKSAEIKKCINPFFTTGKAEALSTSAKPFGCKGNRTVTAVTRRKQWIFYALALKNSSPCSHAKIVARPLQRTTTFPFEVYTNGTGRVERATALSSAGTLPFSGELFSFVLLVRDFRFLYFPF